MISSHIASQLGTIDDLENHIRTLEKVIIELPNTEESKKLDVTIGKLEAAIGQNDGTLMYILMRLREEKIISEEAFYNFYNNNTTN